MSTFIDGHDGGPRERLCMHGAGALSEAELLAVILGTGSRDEPVSVLAARVLDELHGLTGLGRATLTELAERKGIGVGKAARVLAALELGVRVSGRPFHPKRPICSSRDVDAALRPRLRDEPREHFVALCLDVRNRPIGERVIAVGSLDSCMFTPADAFRPALSEAASAVVFVHNHPSGEPSPSEEDRRMTNRLLEVSELLGIRLLDHIILGAKGYFSFLDAGLLCPSAGNSIRGIGSSRAHYGLSGPSPP